MNQPDKKQKSNPKVSIGMPVYNGEKSIREALDSLLAQTFTDFELIISDNASTDGTEAICRGYAARDSRIRYVRQGENRGPTLNFQFVLDEAVGEYFMWAAHDDEWDASFVDFCIKNIGESGSIMTAFQVKNRSQNNITTLSLPPLSGRKGQRSDISAFVKNMQPSMFYGLHRRYLLSFFLKQKGFDWVDCYVCLRLIWHFGYICRNDVCLYTAGIDAEKYIVKPFTGNRLNPLRYFIFSMKYILLSGDITTLGRHFAMLFLPYFRLLFPKR